MTRSRSGPPTGGSKGEFRGSGSQGTAAATPAADDDFDVLISAIEHYSYCPRQCGLIHVEQIFDENVYTMRGRLAHERVDSGDDAAAAGTPCARGITLWSEKLGLFGRADLVELRSEGPYPVEYKIGRREGAHADLQLCAQALCLEEMLSIAVPKGAIFYRATRRRHEVVFDEALRRRTVDVIAGIRDMLTSLQVPEAPNDARCRNCSLTYSCMPSVVGESSRMRGLQGTLFRAAELSDGDYEEVDEDVSGDDG